MRFQHRCKILVPGMKGNQRNTVLMRFVNKWNECINPAFSVTTGHDFTFKIIT